MVKQASYHQITVNKTLAILIYNCENEAWLFCIHSLLFVQTFTVGSLPDHDAAYGKFIVWSSDVKWQNKSLPASVSSRRHQLWKVCRTLRDTAVLH